MVTHYGKIALGFVMNLWENRIIFEKQKWKKLVKYDFLVRPLLEIGSAAGRT